LNTHGDLLDQSFTDRASRIERRGGVRGVGDRIGRDADDEGMLLAASPPKQTQSYAMLAYSCRLDLTPRGFALRVCL